MTENIIVKIWKPYTNRKTPHNSLQYEQQRNNEFCLNINKIEFILKKYSVVSNYANKTAHKNLNNSH